MKVNTKVIDQESFKNMCNLLEQKLLLNDENKNRLAISLDTVILERGENYIRKGEIANKVGFVTSGVFRFLYINRDGKEVTEYFSAENNLVTSMDSFFNNITSYGTLQAVTKCEILEFNVETWKYCKENIPNWQSYILELSNQCLVQVTSFQKDLLSQDAMTSYHSFLKEFPEIQGRVPLSQVASFLNINQSTLSRIRKNMLTTG